MIPSTALKTSGLIHLPFASTGLAGSSEADRTILSASEPLQTGVRAARPPLPSRPPGPTTAIVSPGSVAPYPARIIILRHAEKTGTVGDPGLSPQGQQRAQALATVIPSDYPHVDYIFAAAPSSSSNRPVLTITPTADRLGLPINEDYTDKQYTDLANTLMTDPRYRGKTIVICWHHGEIPQLTQALGATPPQDPWPTNTFDRFWQIDYGPQGQTRVQNLPQKALPGDSST